MKVKYKKTKVDATVGMQFKEKRIIKDVSL